jgi:phage-related protein
MSTVKVLSDVRAFINGLSDSPRIWADIHALETPWTPALVIKKLRGKVKELVVGQCRIVFFAVGSTIYVIDAFKKQSQKTPRSVIERATDLYNQLNK